MKVDDMQADERCYVFHEMFEFSARRAERSEAVSNTRFSVAYTIA